MYVEPSPHLPFHYLIASLLHWEQDPLAVTSLRLYPFAFSKEIKHAVSHAPPPTRCASVRPAVLAPEGSILLATPRVFTSAAPKKNMSQNEQGLTSEPMSKPSTGPSIQSL
jgi:hypothetical protein